MAKRRSLDDALTPEEAAFVKTGKPAKAKSTHQKPKPKPKKETPPMTGIQFVTDEKGRKLAVQIDLKRYGAVLEDFWDGLISESRRKEKGVPLEKLKADLVKRGRLRG